MTTRDRDQADPEARAARLVEMLEAHEAYRGSCLNLVAAENVLSPLARGTLDSELVHRYADYVGRDLRARKYLGTGWIVEIEESVHVLLRALFRGLGCGRSYYDGPGCGPSRLDQWHRRAHDRMTQDPAPPTAAS